MTDEERRAWLRTLVLLAVVAAARWGWAHRPGHLPPLGFERDVAAAMDTVRELRAEADRRSRPLARDETLDPNTADAPELDRLPGVGPATAAAIVAARAGRPFATVDDLLAVPGIGPATLAKIEPHLRIPAGAAARGPLEASASPARVDVNRASATELETLPGIGPAIAGRIVRDRIESGPYARADDLLRVAGIGPVTLERIRARIQVR